MVKFKYLGVPVTYTNDIREKIKHRTNMGKPVYSLGKILSPSQLSKKLKVSTYKTVILPVALSGYETSSLKNKVLRKRVGTKIYKITGEWRKLHNKLHAMHSSPDIIRNRK